MSYDVLELASQFDKFEILTIPEFWSCFYGQPGAFRRALGYQAICVSKVSIGL